MGFLIFFELIGADTQSMQNVGPLERCEALFVQSCISFSLSFSHAGVSHLQAALANTAHKNKARRATR